MDLFSGLPYWIAKNALEDYFNPLQQTVEAEVAIIGGGITGALVAYKLCEAGFDCVIVDKRGISEGSTTSSTALLQYEIDTPLSELAEMIGEQKAVRAYNESLNAVAEIVNLVEKEKLDVDLKKVPSIFYASDRKGHKIIDDEMRIRSKHQIPVGYLTRSQLEDKYGFSAPAALVNHVSAQIDPYATSTSLIRRLLDSGAIRYYTHTQAEKIHEKKSHCIITTSEGHKIKSRYVVVAAGFEAGKFMRRKVMKLTSTYAIISSPVHENNLWPERALIWETAQPYLYIRTDRNRIIVGGEDVNFRNPASRDRLLHRKSEILAEKFKKLFPAIPFEEDMHWCGTFSSTDDGLPFIGPAPGKYRTFYALGYGGNGITFSMIAANLIRNKLTAIPDDREEIFGFERLKFVK